MFHNAHSIGSFDKNHNIARFTTVVPGSVEKILTSSSTRDSQRYRPPEPSDTA